MRLIHKAYAVHMLTASGALFAFLALLAAADKDWRLMFMWLLVALVIDGIDGPLARHYRVEENAPKINGVNLDLMIDYMAWIVVPAFALVHSDLMPGWFGVCVAVAICANSALYTAHTDEKMSDNSFQGFPACWNMVLLILFVADLATWHVFVSVLLLNGAMWLPTKFIHPIRTVRWRCYSLGVLLLWCVSAVWVVWVEFKVSWFIQLVLYGSTTYLLVVGAVQQLFPEKK